MKLKLVIFLFLIQFFKNCQLQQLCSVKKSDNTCICSHITDETGTPLIIGDCARIDLQQFPDASQLTNNLNLLDLSHNKIEKLENSYTYSSLSTLILSYNYINTINDNFFTGFPNLEKLILSHNNLTTLNSIFQNMSKLQHLDLSFNNIKTLPHQIFAILKVLDVLDLSYNDLGLGEWLTQSPNALTTNLGITTNLSHLIMNNIGLKELHQTYFGNYTNLKYLCLADNHFENIPTVPYSVQYLDISGADITTIQAKFLNYHSLKTLKLNRMKRLTSIHPYAFYNLPELEELSITDCRNLREFKENVFAILSKDTHLPLRRLSLARNGLQSLNSTYKYLFKTLELIDLRDNPWKCDCDVLWFQEFDNFYKNESIRCSSPGFLIGKKIFDITKDNLHLCHPEIYGKRSHRIMIPILIILVMILSALIGYLIYYGPSWYGQRSRTLGPQSPYSRAASVQGD